MTIMGHIRQGDGIVRGEDMVWPWYGAFSSRLWEFAGRFEVQRGRAPAQAALRSGMERRNRGVGGCGVG